jgi:hypothetical protein
MDPATPRRRGRLSICFLVLSLAVLLSLSVPSAAEVITLTEETFSDKVPSLPQLSPLPLAFQS